MILHPTENHPRLDLYLANKLSISREKSKTLIKQGSVLLNGVATKVSSGVKLGDCLEVIQHKPLTESLIKEINSLDILYEDASILVLNKTKGDLVHSGSGSEGDTVVDYLQRNGYQLASEAGVQRPGIVHRLDRFTEGLMVIAKTNESYHDLKKQFQNRSVVKKYYAMVQGNLTHDEGEIDMPIQRHPSKRHLMHVSKDGKPAVTRYRVLQRFNTKTCVDVQILTGRTHQIRVHFAFIGHPILKDASYGSDSKAEGQSLQSYYLSFCHPVTRLQMRFSVPSAM